MLPLPSCLPPLAHVLGQVRAWHCPMVGPSFTLPGLRVSGLGLYLCIQPKATVGVCTESCTTRGPALPLGTWGGI